VSERNAAIAYEQHRAEMVLHNQRANEAARADVMRLKTKSADEISAMASQALKLAESAKAKAELKLREAEATQAEHEALAREADRLRGAAKEELIRSQRLSAEAIVKAETSKRAVSESAGALEAAQASYATERRELIKAVDDARREGEARLLEYKEQAALHELKRKEEEGRAHLESARKAQSEASNESERHTSKLAERLRETDLELKRVRAQLQAVSSDQTAALRNLRSAYATRVSVRPIGAKDREHANEIAASAVEITHLGEADDTLAHAAPVGVVCGFRVSASAAMTMGFGAESADLEPLHLLLQGGSGGGGPSGASGVGRGASASALAIGGAADGRKPVAPAAVAVRLGSGSWAVRYVFDEPLWASADAAPLWGVDLLDEASLGAKSVVIANKEGLVLARGTVTVVHRDEGTERSARFDYRKAKRAATRLQAIYRGKHLRGRRAAAQPLPGLGPAFTDLLEMARNAGGAGAGRNPPAPASSAGNKQKGAPSTAGKGGGAGVSGSSSSTNTRRGSSAAPPGRAQHPPK
jgi:chemotaxis protein histidine kinase CheA